MRRSAPANAAVSEVGGSGPSSRVRSRPPARTRSVYVARRLPPGDQVYVPVDLCNATNGRLFIQSSGVVTVQAEGGTFSNAQCFTSLDGASFGAGATGSRR